MSEDPQANPVRVTVVQPSLAKYRVPVFRELAQRDGIDLTVRYGQRNNLKNVAADGFKAEPAKFYEPVVLGQKILFHPAQYQSVTKKEADVVVCTWTPRYLSLAPALLRAKASGVGLVLWGHGFSKSDRWWWGAARKVLTQLTDSVLFYDEETAQDFIGSGFPSERVFVAYNSIDHSEIEQARRHWENAPAKLEQFRRDNGLGAGPVLLFVSRLLPENRVDLLIQATRELGAEHPGLRTVIIGSGGGERHRLAALSQQLGVTERVILLDGIYEEESLAPWFLSADLFCYPQNIGLSILHAMWYGKPVVTSDDRSCQNPEIVALKDGENGLVYRHGDVQSLSETIRGALADRSRLAKLSSAARATVEKNFRVDRMVDGMEAAIRYAANR